MRRRSRVLLAAILIAWPAGAFAESRQPPASWQEEGLAPVSALPVESFAAIDPEHLRKVDSEEAKAGEALQFAIPYASDADLHRQGSWETLASGDHLWRLRVDVPGATDINFGFRRFWLPPGATLHIYEAERTFFQGPWGAAHNKPHGQFWTPVVPGDSAVIELRVPAGTRAQPLVQLEQVAGGYRDFFGRYGGPFLRNHGSCNIDVVCPEGDSWRDQIRSVGVYQRNGFWACTGQLVNDVPHSLTPHFLTAHHCGVTAASAPTLVVYWNFEAPVCGQQDGGSLAQNQSGSTVVATRSDVDMTLVVLDDDPDESFDVHFSGWDRSNTQPGGAVAIHHPRTHVKSISFAFSNLGTTASCIGGPGTPNTHWHVPFWNDGTTEPGSSGSGIWNPQNGRLIGFLSGGLASCTVIDFDCYGKFAVAWEGASAASRLKDWLDPGGVDPDGIDGTDPESFNIVPEATAFSQCGFADLGIGLDITQSGDFDDPVTLGTAGLPGGVTSSFSANPVEPPASSVLTLGSLAGAGAGSFAFAVEGSGGGLDRSVDLAVFLAENTPGETEVTAPPDGAIGVPATPVIEWTAAAEAFQYEVQIASDPAFAGIVYSAVVFGTSHQVSSPLATNQTYHLRVRALNECGDGAWSQPVSFTTEALPGDCPLGTDAQTVFYESFGGGALPPGWSTAGSSGAVTWVASSAQSYDGAFSMFAQNISTVSDQRLATPAIGLPGEADFLFLNFQNWQHIEHWPAGGCYDGGILEISTNDGLTWSQVVSEILEREYDGPVSTVHSNPLGGLQAWCGDPRDFWERYAVDLSPWAGQNVRFRFRFGTDSSVPRVGWFLDAVEVKACFAGAPELAFSPSSLDFGEVVVGEASPPQIATLSNLGGDAAAELAFELSGSEGFTFDATDCGTSLPAGESCEVSVVFAPIAPGAAQATLEASSHLGGAAELALEGTGAVLADLAVSKAADQPLVGNGDTLIFIVTVENLGLADVSGASVVDQAPGDLTAVTWTCTPSGGASCTGAGVLDIDDEVDLPAGGWVTYVIEGVVDTGALSFDNTATAQAPSGVVDPDASNDSATVTVLTCAGDEEVVLENLDITTSELFVASGTLTAGPGVRVLEEGDATLRACGRVVLRNGFSVEGGRLEIQVRAP
jgi:lysyl endopeptidase